MAETKARELAELARGVDDSNITLGSEKTLDVSGGTLTLADDQISGDKVEGGTITSTTITSLTTGTISEAVADAGVSIDGVVAKDSKVFAPSGIVFASAEITGDDAGTANRVESSNLLDDYEEGTWTPILKNNTSTVTTSDKFGVYTKIGRTVFVHGYVRRESSVSYTGTMTIEGLPFNSANITGNLSLTGGYWADNGNSTTNYSGNTYMGSSSGTIRFLPEQPSGVDRYITTDQLANGRFLYFSAVYQAI